MAKKLLTRNKALGFVLPAVLIFMQIYALLGITALEQVFVTQKYLAEQRAKRLLFNQAEQLLQELRAPFSQACRIAPLSPSLLATYSLQWWDGKACITNEGDFKSYYVIEVLDPESAVYRLTVLLIKKQDDNLRLILQRTLLDSEPQAWYELR